MVGIECRREMFSYTIMARVGGQSLRGRYRKHPVAGIVPNQRYRTAEGGEDELASAKEIRLTEIVGRS
ncbi:hypothetical protein ARMGADRAFT_1016339 [Armillaria gallica]|uniref:Uncharacterized protein n=1 Tax=Armillaria gallica TaxID=47427 RepID=A0A2H3DIJ8_ARMGA|nr:hypothetical protein ARMGADRAFT_1016339 [Armillaria gallica]